MLFEFPIRIYWEDTDAGGIVFYANYLKFFERARSEWLRSLGIGQQQLKQTTGGMFVVTETAVKYLQPARLDDTLLVNAQLEQCGKASLVIRQQAHLLAPKNAPQTPAELLCEGSIRIGWIDAASFRPARIPSSILEKLQ